jgi:hypothetical protein
MQLLNDAAGDAGVAHAAVQMLVPALTDCSAERWCWSWSLRLSSPVYDVTPTVSSVAVALRHSVAGDVAAAAAA